MRSIVLSVAVAGAGCGIDPSSPPATGQLRWLPGLNAIAATETATDDAALAMSAYRDIEPDCGSGSSDVMAIVADVAPAHGDETVLASIPHGVVVVDRARRAIASARPLPCGGSADELLALAIGDVGLARPVIVVVGEIGGRAESSTRLAILQVSDGHLRVLFDGTIADRDRDSIRRATISVTDGVVMYRPPDGPTTTIPLEDNDR